MNQINLRCAKKLSQIASQLVEAGNEVGERNGLPYCKNCGLDLITLGNSIGLIADELKEKYETNE